MKRQIKQHVPKPPPIPHHKGKQFMRMIEPERSVNMDAGVFDYLWRVAEHRYREAQANAAVHPEHADLMERTVGVFRRAMAAEAPEAPPVRRRVVRRN